MGSDLKTDLQMRGCAVCNHVEEAIFAHFSQLQYNVAHNEDIRRSVADGGGFCRFHTWQLAAFSSARGLAKGLPPLLSRIADELLRMADHAPDEGIERTIPGERIVDCRICELLCQEETVYVKRLIAFLHREKGLSIYGASQGVCLWHLGLLVKSASPETERFLLIHAANRFREMEIHLKTYDEKLESGNRGDCSPAEKNAGYDALIHLAGSKYLSFPMK
jgi:hypothetical protein